MKKALSALLAVILVLSASQTVFGATKNDAKKVIESSVSFAFDGVYGETGYTVSDSKDFYIHIISGADASAYKADYLASVKEALEAGTLSGIKDLGMVICNLQGLGENPADFYGFNLVEMLKETTVELKFDETNTQRVFLNGKDVSDLIRTPEISMGASNVSKIPQVREFLLELQRSIARENNVIMDGRDIATVVLPNANVKIFLFASPECRAERRYKELIEKGENVTYDEVLADVNARDYQDSHREIAPLKPTKDSVMADTSLLTLDESIELIKSIIKGDK